MGRSQRVIPSLLLTLLLLCGIFSCTSDNKESSPTAFSLLQADRTGLHFSNDLPIDISLNILNYMYYYNGGGLAAGDLNNDGWTDLIFSSNLGPEKVFLNKQNLEFEDVSDQCLIDGGPTSWTNGVSIVDINADGLLDVYLSQVGNYRNIDCNNKLFICTEIDENGMPHYMESAKKYGLDFKGFSTQAGFFDYDLDGDLDMYLMNHSLHHNGTFGQRSDFITTQDSVSGDRLFRNDGEIFTDVTIEAGILSNVIGYGLGLSFGDVNNDRYPDIYIGNDFHENDYLYINQKDGSFEESLTQAMKHTSRFSMGVDIEDINSDGHKDIISLDMLPEDPVILKSSEGEDALDIFRFKLGYGYNHQYAKNALQLNQGNDTYKEIASYAGLHASDWSWSPLIFDFNMDKKQDVFITNGIPRRMNDLDYINFISGNDVQYKIQFDELENQDLSVLEKIPEIKLKNKFFQQGPQIQFKDIDTNVAKHQKSYSNSAVYADFDNDGDYDVVTNNIDDKAFLYRNESIEPTVRVILKSYDKNPNAIGAQIKAEYATGETCFKNYTSTRGFQSSMINEILFPKLDLKSISVIWPNGHFSETKEIEEDSIVMLFEDAILSNPVENFRKTFFTNVSQNLNLEYTHKENPFIEFNREALIPFSTSSEGPALAVGDINGDGQDDIFVGSSKRKRNKLFVSHSDGSYRQSRLNGIEADSIYEEVDAFFIDIDKDKDLDLLIVTGGNEYRLNSPYTQAQLFKNKNGELHFDPKAFEGIHLTGSCASPTDFDDDGDIDLFLGARALPWEYGEIPTSFLLANNGEGHFTDVTDQLCPAIKNIGFVKDASWQDLDGDNQKELIICREWNALTYMQKSANGKYVMKDIGKEQAWWNNISCADFDQDGDIDIFAGNLGLNSRLKATKDQPLRMYYYDFDGNGRKEQILSYYIKGKEIPFSNLVELQKQIPTIKKEFLYAKDFANSTIQEIFGKEALENATTYSADFLENALYINDGAGNFSLKKLPLEAQFSSYYAALPEDLDQDGDIDLIVGGNYHNCNVQMGRYDAENGAYLLNDGRANFTYHNMEEAPLKEQVRHIEKIVLNKKSHYVISQNNGPLTILKLEGQ